jgi:hypothetical protein
MEKHHPELMVDLRVGDVVSPQILPATIFLDQKGPSTNGKSVDAWLALSYQ